MVCAPSQADTNDELVRVDSNFTSLTTTAPMEAATPPPTAVRNGERRPRRQRQRTFSIPTSKDEFFMVQEKHATEANKDPWQVRLLRFLNSSPVQHILISLWVLDVCILFIELAIDAGFPSCQIVTRDAVSCCPSTGEDDANHTLFEMDDISRVLSGSDGHHEELCETPLVEAGYTTGCDDHKYKCESVLQR